MKKRIYCLPAIIVLLLTGCRQNDYLLYNDAQRLQFGPGPDSFYISTYDLADTLKSYTFTYHSEEVTTDTTWFDLYTIGGISNADRPFMLEQLPLEGVENAVAGRHYKSFDDHSLQPFYVIKAGKVHCKVPVVMLRDASLKQKTVLLKLTIKANENFLSGNAARNWRKLEITDRLSQPLNWTKLTQQFGKYSLVKHQFMVELTGERWDQAFLAAMLTDVSLTLYWRDKVKKGLIEYNLSHPGAPLKDEFEQDVVFP